MSFILDALKKSETDRQQKGSAEFAGVPTSGGRREGPPAWMWIVGVLLVINLAVLIGIFLRPEVTNEPVGAASAAIEKPVGGPSGSIGAEAPPTTPSTTPSTQDFAAQVAAARENAPVQEEPVATPVEPEPQVSAGSVSIQPTTTAMLPTVHEVQARGLVSLPPLHVDIHVYSEAAEDRFVFINMAKHKEGSRLDSGPLVAEITPEGVVLEQDGTRFLLPRD